MYSTLHYLGRAIVYTIYFDDARIFSAENRSIKPTQWYSVMRRVRVLFTMNLHDVSYLSTEMQPDTIILYADS